MENNLTEIQRDIFEAIKIITDTSKKTSISLSMAQTLNELIEAYGKISQLNIEKKEHPKSK